MAALAQSLRLVEDADEPAPAGQLGLRPASTFVHEAKSPLPRPCRKRRKAPGEPVEIKQLDFIIIKRPRTYGECAELVTGPCPFVSCSHHLYLDVNPRTGHLKIRFPDKEPWELEETCVLRAVDKHGELPLVRAGRLMNITGRAVLRIERIAREKFTVIDGGD